jgi:hypothetical protein
MDGGAPHNTRWNPGARLTQTAGSMALMRTG